MKGRRIAWLTVTLIGLAVSGWAATIIIPSNTVVSATMDTTLNSATARAGDRFQAHHEGVNGGGFPEMTIFLGRVDSVVRGSRGEAGQIGVSFHTARLPNGTAVPIDGYLVSLDNRNVRTDPETGRLVGTNQARKSPGKFIAYGAGAGLVIGQLAGKRAFLGAVIGAAAGYLYGQSQGRAAIGKNVRVPAGTRFGILLTEDVALTGYGHPGGIGSGPGSGWRVTFPNRQPLMRSGELMLPFAHVMRSMGMPFDYERSTEQIHVRMRGSHVTHTVGTGIVHIDGRPVRLGAQSAHISGAIYVPAGLIELLTDRDAYWNAQTGVLWIR